MYFAVGWYEWYCDEWFEMSDIYWLENVNKIKFYGNVEGPFMASKVNCRFFIFFYMFFFFLILYQLLFLPLAYDAICFC